MAKQLKNIFNAGTDEIQQSFIINAAHVSQSTDAFTGVDDYSIAISGTFQMVDGTATFATGNYAAGGGIVFSGQSGSVSSPPLALWVSDNLQTANILADKETLIIRNGNTVDGYGSIRLQVDQPGTSSSDVFDVAKFGSGSLGTYLYHTGSLVFYTDSGSSGLGIVSTGYVSGSKAYLSQTENISQDYVIGFDSTTGELTYFSTASFGGFNTGSLMITGSVTDNILTFEKGDGTTFNLTVDTGSGGGGGSVDTGSLLTTASVSDATVTFTKGDGSTFDITINNVESASYATNSSSSLHAVNAQFAGSAVIASTAITANTALTANTASYVPDAVYTGSALGNVLTFTQFDGDIFNLTVDTGSGGGSPTDTGSLMLTGSVAGNVLTFTKGDASTFDLTVTTGSGATDTGSLLTTASISDATITFTKGNGSTFDIEVNNVTSSISSSYAVTSSYVANAFYSGSVLGNVLTFTQFDGDQSVLTVDTGSGGGGSTDTGSLMVTGSVAGNTLTFTKGDASTFDLTVTTGSGATDTGSLMLTGSVAGNVLTFTKGDASTFDLTVTTGSGATDTGSLLTTASISDATVTFTKGDGSTFDIEVNNVTSSISSSYALTASYALNATSASYGPNIYNTDGILTGNRSLELNNNNLTFDALQGEVFQTFLDNAATHSIRVSEGMVQILPGTGFAEVSSSYLLTYDTSDGRVQYMSTASFGGGGSVDTGSLLTTGSISGNVSTFTKGDASTFDLTFDTGSFYISSSVTATGNGVVLTKGNGTKNTLNLNVSPGGVYDITNRSSGSEQYSTQLLTIIGTTSILSGSVNQKVGIGEIANLELGNQVHITATQYGAEGTFAKKNISIYETGGGSTLPASINGFGDITFEFNSAATVDTPIMYHIMYTTDTPTRP